MVILLIKLLNQDFTPLAAKTTTIKLLNLSEEYIYSTSIIIISFIEMQTFISLIYIFYESIFYSASIFNNYQSDSMNPAASSSGGLAMPGEKGRVAGIISGVVIVSTTAASMMAIRCWKFQRKKMKRRVSLSNFFYKGMENY